jgi:hypothetical protein
MTTNERRLWNEGKELWFEYVGLNDYSTKYTKQGLIKLSKMLDLNESYITERLDIYLNN